MRISLQTIENVKALDITTVIGKYVKLKAKGPNYSACCPIHGEKTPSFSVSTAKQIYKCFGCGKAGDSIAFVMEMESFDFIQAIEKIATDNSIEVQYENYSEEKTKEHEEKKKEREAIRIVMNYAASYYQSNSLPDKWANHRKFSEETINKFKIGYAGNAFYKDAITAGYSTEILLKAGLIYQDKEDNSRFFDAFRNRIIFPVQDVYGNVVALSGRINEDAEPKENSKDKTNKEEKKGPPKYYNSPDTVWSKGSNLYGINLAYQAIRKAKFAYQVEGNADVVQCHQKGLTNTVAPCGTALTEEQIKLLARYTDTVCIIPDNDEAGRNALKKNAELYIKNNFHVKVLFPDINKDPDDQLKKCHTQKDVEEWTRNEEDYISGYLLRECLEKSDNPKDKADSIVYMGSVLELIPNDILRQTYYSDIAEQWNDFKKSYKLQERSKVDVSNIEKLKKNERAAFFDFNFWEDEGCYYTYDKNKKIRICNFTIDILYFILSNDDPKYVCKLTNVFGKVRHIVITTDEFATVGSFKKKVARLNNFIFEGNDSHLDKIKIKLFHGVKEGLQPSVLGYNRTGNFYTWANGIYFNGNFYPHDKHGIVTLKRKVESIEEIKKLPSECHLEINGNVMVMDTFDDLFEKFSEEELKQYISEAKFYYYTFYYLKWNTSFNFLSSEDDGDYDSERKFRHFQKPGLTFSEWAAKIVDVYFDNGKVMICFYIASLFRDIIYKENNNWFPILYHFGKKQGGKSKAAESIASMFGEVLPDGINLESGSTHTGIRRYMSSVQNGLIWLNEYKNTLKKEAIGMLKGIADGSGKLTGMNTGGNETKSYTPRSSALICGQDLPTVDPALFSRCLINEFSSEGRNKLAFDLIKSWEKEGKTTSVTCELLNYRSYMSKYRKESVTMFKILKQQSEEILGLTPEDRAIQNAVSILAPVKILMEETSLHFPFTLDDITKILIDRIRIQTNIQATSDDVEQYLMVIASMIGRLVLEGEHYMIVKEKGETNIYIRVKAIHNFYRAEALRQQIVPLDVSTITSYIEKHRAFVRYESKNAKFDKLTNRTSAYILNYAMLLEQGIEFKTDQDLDQEAFPF